MFVTMSPMGGRSSPGCQPALAILGPITVSAVVAAVGDPKQFKSGRQLTAPLSLPQSVAMPQF
jgi:hypothetical protein